MTDATRNQDLENHHCSLWLEIEALRFHFKEI